MWEKCLWYLEMILLKFDGVFDFIKNEEDFLNFVAIYKCSDIKNGEIVIFDDITRVKYNYAFFKTNKDSVEEFKKRNSNIIKYEINEDGFIEKISIKVNIEGIPTTTNTFKRNLNSSIVSLLFFSSLKSFIILDSVIIKNIFINSDGWKLPTYGITNQHLALFISFPKKRTSTNRKTPTK